MTDITWLGHATFTISDGTDTVLIDPWLTGNPKASISADDVNATTILLTHGHSDHIGDALPIAKRTGAPVVSILEIAEELAQDGAETVGLNFGGSAKFDWGWAKLVPAWHTSTTPKGTVSFPGGFLINFKGKVIYHTGDTALFSDLALVGKRNPIDVVLLCAGGHFTLDPTDAVDAADLIKAQTVIPCHYGTFPAIEIDVNQLQSDINNATSSHCVVLEPGGTHTI